MFIGVILRIAFPDGMPAEGAASIMSGLSSVSAAGLYRHSRRNGVGLHEVAETTGPFTVPDLEIRGVCGFNGRVSVATTTVFNAEARRGGKCPMNRGGRYELKYVVEESRARAITGFLRGYLRPSPYNRSGTVFGEPVASLYFDSPDLLFYHQNFAGLRNRIKLRIRFYDNDWERPAFLEIKRRVNDVICKDRTMVSREVVRQMLRQGWPSLSGGSRLAAADYGTRQAAVQQQFSSLCNAVQARAVLYVSYVREAYIGIDNGDMRVTVDRQIRATAYEGEDVVEVPQRGAPPRPLALPPNCAVLELKFTRTCPRWMQQMVRLFNLHRRSFCKYCVCSEALGLPQGRRGLSVPQWEIVS